MSFLSQRVNLCAEEDHEKLRRLIRCAISSIDELAHIGTTDLSEVTHYVDAAHGVHIDSRSHTGEATTM